MVKLILTTLITLIGLFVKGGNKTSQKTSKDPIQELVVITQLKYRIGKSNITFTKYFKSQYLAQSYLRELKKHSISKTITLIGLDDMVCSYASYLSLVQGASEA